MIGTDEPGTRSWWASSGIAVGVGAVLGVITFLLQGVLPDGWSVLANSGAVWLTVALVLGMVLPGLTTVTALLSGAAVEIALVLGYYGAAPLAGYASSPRSVLLWCLVGVVGGPVFTLAGALWRQRRWPWLAGGLFGGIWVGEGIHVLGLTEQSGYGPTGWVQIVVGVVVALALGRSTWDRLLALASTAGGAVAMMAAEKLIELAFLSV
ncbi:DUF6518 family protein [Allokutzneria oryzae]|uniref:DUF6518 family protein n=1 Tax=Allokutzneria oryzae TaxID=1378989 RepID=A0ABV6A2C6_9PSEU